MTVLRVPFFSDIVVDATIAITQILIARLFFAEWRRLLPAWLSRAMTYVLYTLWVVTVAGALLRYASVVRLVRWIPVTIRGTLIATGNVWGVTAVASLGIYYAYHFLTRNLSLAHSPGRRR